ncbi:MAG: hypothetical protein EXX96DRAFT_514380 [Benjaminiella poitrasii]|nr:MAG: hypothetical protein EXX96DRAFT_514380 [Benjaminiella poitrasii]
MAENKVIIDYVNQRITAEKNHALTLTSLSNPTGNKDNPFENDIGASLKKCFEVVRAESEESGKEHMHRANNINITALQPLQRFFQRYDRIILQSSHTIEKQISQLNIAWKAMMGAKTVYQSKCKTLLNHYPDFEFRREENGTSWFDSLFSKEKEPYPKNTALQILKDTLVFENKEDEAEVILNSFVSMNFLLKFGNEDIFYLVGEGPTKSGKESNKGFSGLLGKWGNQESKKEDLVKEMFEADKAYRKSVKQAEKMRIQTEQILLVHYEEMEGLELERIQTIKQAFISMAASLSNTIPRCKETFDNMMLYQETLKPDKDVEFIVEQYRTGQYCPRPILYVNYFTGTAEDQLFGAPLEEVTRVQNTLVPQFISQSLAVIESGFSKLYDEEKSVVWTTSLPLDRVYAAQEEIDACSHLLTVDRLKKFDLLLLASLVRLYLLELPECLFTFELYEPCKLLYSNHQDQTSRLMSISKLIATLPTSNYHTVMLLLGHFHKLVKEINTDTQQFTISITKAFSYILLRPQTESKVSLHERHPQRLLQDLIENFDLIFTQESYRAQEKNSSRPSIIIPEKQSESANSSSTHDEQKTNTNHYKNGGGITIIPLPSSSTLFEDPDEIIDTNCSESSACITTPSFNDTVHSSKSSMDPINHHRRSIEDTFIIEDLASLDSFFEDKEN